MSARAIAGDKKSQRRLGAPRGADSWSRVEAGRLRATTVWYYWGSTGEWGKVGWEGGVRLWVKSD